MILGDTGHGNANLVASFYHITAAGDRFIVCAVSLSAREDRLDLKGVTTLDDKIVRLSGKCGGQIEGDEIHDGGTAIDCRRMR